MLLSLSHIAKIHIILIKQAILSKFLLVIKIPKILGECLTCLVSGGSSDLCLMESPQHIDSGECPPACVTADQLILWEELSLNHSIDLGLPLDILVEFPSDVLQEFLHISVIGRDISLDRCFVTIFLQDLVGSIGIHAHFVNVNPALRTCLDLHDGEDIAVKAGSVNPHHVGESLPKRAGEYEMIPYPLHVPDVLTSPLNR